jgi:hypothetical protein
MRRTMHTRMFLSLVRNFSGRPEQGLAEAERALTLDPNLAGPLRQRLPPGCSLTLRTMP